jgi:NAD(P)-dependent dehydrogenase (short-subunit alcohol dehydrogenase family)
MWDEVIAVNLGGPFNVTHAVLPTMLETGWGRIINISSIVGQWGNFGQANYAATKGGLIAFTQTLAREVAKKGITCNAVAPGFIETDMTKDLPDPAKAAGVLPDAAGAVRQARGSRGGGRVPRLARGELHHRPGAGGERGDVHVTGPRQSALRISRLGRRC